MELLLYGGQSKAFSLVGQPEVAQMSGEERARIIHKLSGLNG